jgi:hypothetical protein
MCDAPKLLRPTEERGKKLSDKMKTNKKIKTFVKWILTSPLFCDDDVFFHSFVM